jgi:serine/threonine-protein kinase HipA
MKLAPGQALSVQLWQDESALPLPAARVAMSAGLVQLEWSAELIASQLALSPVNYPLEAGLQPATGRAFEGLHGFLADSLPEGW